MIVRLLCLLTFIFISLDTFSCTLTMGYRTNEKLPYIHKSPNNNGLYLTLYKKALNNIGCKLNVIRAPKKRIMYMLESGDIDFYPGLGYNEEREKFIHFFNNGMTNKSIAISRVDIEDIHSIDQIQGYTLVVAQGANPNSLFVDKSKLSVRSVYDLSIEKAVELIQSHGADFYVYSEDVIKYYLALNPNKNIKIHPCCSERTPMQLGFSKSSPHAEFKANPHYNALLPSSNSNLKEVTLPDSIAFKFKQELKKLSENGTTQKIFDVFINELPIKRANNPKK